MGFWFKYNLSLVFNDGYVFDSGLMKSSNIDNVLILSIYIFITIIVANQISKLEKSALQLESSELKKNKYSSIVILLSLIAISLTYLLWNKKTYLNLYLIGSHLN